MSEIMSHESSDGEIKMMNGSKVPSLGNLAERLPTQRSVSSFSKSTKSNEPLKVALAGHVRRERLQ